MPDNIEKVYIPTVIEDNPFPQDIAENQSVSQAKQGTAGDKIYSPESTPDQIPPIKKYATELLSAALNTRSKKILQEWQFTPSGALQIGKLTIGVNGDIRISPSGIVARNSLGSETFVLDGETGDALFAGTIRAGAITVNNTIVTEQSSNGNGRTVYYNNGIPSIVLGDPS